MTTPTRPPRRVPKINMTFSCDADFFDRVDGYALRHDISRSLAIRQLITAGLAAPPAAAGDQVPGQMEMAS